MTPTLKLDTPKALKQRSEYHLVRVSMQLRSNVLAKLVQTKASLQPSQLPAPKGVSGYFWVSEGS